MEVPVPGHLAHKTRTPRAATTSLAAMGTQETSTTKSFNPNAHRTGRVCCACQQSDVPFESLSAMIEEVHGLGGY